MRISTSSFFSATLLGIRNQQSSISRLSQQLSSGQKLLSAKDDPVANTRIMSLKDGLALRTQFAANQVKLDITQKEEATVLSELQTTLTKARQLIVDGHSSQDQNLRNQSAATLAGYYNHIKDLVNFRDSSGNSIFAGFETSTQPYSHTAVFDPTSSGPAVSMASGYAGDAGTRQAEVDQGRFLPANDDLGVVMRVGVAGSDVLQTIDQSAVDLRDTSLPQATLEANLDNAYATLTAAIGSLKNIQSALVGRQLELADMKSTNQQLMNISTDALGEMTQVDQASVIIELQLRQTALEAAESAFARTSGLSLFNYLS